MPGRLHLLIVDDNQDFLDDFIVISREYFKISTANTGETALKRLDEVEPDAVILDLCLGAGIDGLETMKRIREKNNDLPVIMVTDFASVETAVEAMKLGAVHYMSKHPNMKALQAIIERELNNIHWKKLYRDVVHRQFGEIVGESSVMREVYKRIDLVANNKVSILIEGESGTGKELVAREIHKRGNRREHPFVAVNCAAIPSALFESELFGHEKGAFTGAVNRKMGKFEYAHKGTLFLDEITALTPEFQAKLLRVVEERAFTRVGGNSLIKVDVRILSASNRPLAQEVRKGTFREDLFHRINGIDIQVPPLRVRGNDIVRLANHFSNKYGTQSSLESRFSAASIKALKNYNWPGNVRELHNVIERVHILVKDRLVEPGDLQLQSDCDPDTPVMIRKVLMSSYEKAKTEVLSQFKKYYLTALLERHDGNVGKAALEAGIPRQSLYRMLNE